jgi:hypothetical protein
MSTLARPTPRRSPEAWLLALRALRRVVWVRLALWRWPYARVRVELAARTRSRRDPPAVERRSSCLEADPRALAWAVRAAARRVPHATCLTQALTLEAMLAEAGHLSDVRIGVARTSEGRFEAHAWLEFGGDVLIGDLPDLQRFAIMPGEPVGGRSR